MNEQADKAGSAPSRSAAAQAGYHPQAGKSFSPRSAGCYSGNHASNADSPAYSIPIGRPISDADYENMKQAATTASPTSDEAPGQEDGSILP